MNGFGRNGHSCFINLKTRFICCLEEYVCSKRAVTIP